MAAKSDNKYDVYDWIKQVIDSCQTYFHYGRVHKLIDNFFDMYRESAKKCSETTKGISKEFKTVNCPHCTAQGGANVMRRWHFDNCKAK